MKKTFALLLVILLAFTFGSAEAQVGNYLKKKAIKTGSRAGEKADEEVSDEMNNRVDKEVGKALNKWFGSGTDSTDAATEPETTGGETPDNSSSPGRKSSSDARSSAMLKAMGINMTPANVKEKYEYSGHILMNMESWDENGESEGNLDYYTYVAEGEESFAMKFEQEGKGMTTMIFDYENEAMIILSDDGSQKTGVVTQYEGLKDTVKNQLEEDEGIEADEEGDYSSYNSNLKKTGRSKTIAGFKCDEYLYDDDEYEGVIWMTGELPSDLWAKMFSANIISVATFANYGGFVMEMDQKKKGTKERFYSIVKEVNLKNPQTVSTSGYQMMSFGGMPEE